jgi:hypothetical protein
MCVCVCVCVCVCRYNVSEYDVFFVLPAIIKASAEEEEAFQEFCFDAAYEREVGTCKVRT